TIDNNLNPVWDQSFELIAEDKETQSLIFEELWVIALICLSRPKNLICVALFDKSEGLFCSCKPDLIKISLNSQSHLCPKKLHGKCLSFPLLLNIETCSSLSVSS
ncbi:hypothetical protein Leryth_023319, partial [Lithospermum erythrorhizon]